jgi:hypothetical protein
VYDEEGDGAAADGDDEVAVRGDLAEEAGELDRGVAAAAVGPEDDWQLGRVREVGGEVQELLGGAVGVDWVWGAGEESATAGSLTGCWAAAAAARSSAAARSERCDGIFRIEAFSW